MTSLDQLCRSIQEHLQTAGGPISTKWKVDQSTLSGRGLFATEDISAGEILFVDSPLIFGPRAGTLQQKGCTVCSKLYCDSFYKCSKCALLLCSVECEKTKLHADDCATIACWNNKIPIEEVDDTRLSRALTPIRALILNEDQKQFMLSLQAHELPQHGREVRALAEYFDIPEKDEELMMSACRVLDANAFQIATPYGREEASMRGLFPVSCLMNHNCISNTRHSFDENYRMVVRAVKPIRAGSELFTCYPGMLWGTPARRRHLYNTKHFWCVCERCADPTERGTMLAALKCFYSPCPGSLLPIEPLRTSTPWRCLECDMVVPADHIAAIQGALGSLMGSLDFENVSQLENFLVKRVCKYIPKTNQIVVDLQCRLIWLMGETEGSRWHELTEAQLQLKESLCRGILRTVAALSLGDAHLRGLLLYHLHATLAERARRTPDLYEDIKPEIENTIEQAYNILEGDISAPPDLELRRQYLGPGCEKSQHERFFILET